MIRHLIRSKFKRKGKPFEATDGQCWLFAAIINKKIKWLWDSAPTRYGKSEILAMALLFLASHEGIRIPIVGGSIDKANKIMEYIVGHLPDHPTLYEGLVNVELSKIEKLQISVSKDVLRWFGGGWIFVTSINAKEISKEGEGAVGEGGDVVVLEEAGLIKNKDQFSKVVRMPEENSGWGKLIMSGNCVENSVFEDAFNNPIYYKLRITLEQAINEGRYTAQRVYFEIKPQTTTKDWKRYWEVLFPGKNEYTYFKPKRYEVLPSFDEMEIYGTLDPSLGDEVKDQKKSDQGSKKGVVVLGVHKKTFQKYEIESIVDHIGLDEVIRRIFNMPYKFKRFGIEAIAFQKYFLDEVKKKSQELGRDIPFEGLQQAKSKTERIESMEPTINTGIILFKGDNQLWDDMAEYPKTKFLDGLDALEMCHRISKKKPPSIGIGDEVY